MQPKLILWLVVSLIFCFACLPAGCAAGVNDAAGAQDAGADYLPLAEGKRWVLRSKTTEAPVTFEVVGREAAAYRVNFDNPWVKSELLLVPRDRRVYLAEVNYGGQRREMRSETVYFDFTAPEGASWSNEIGTMKIVSRRKTVKTPGGAYQNCIQILETNPKGDQLFWTFAPNIGWVQFGESGWAFKLTSTGSDLAGAPAPRREETPAPVLRAPAPARRSQEPLYVGLSTNPFANQPINAQSLTERYEQSLAAGVTFLYISPKWNELEPSAGRYNFNSDGFDEKIWRAERDNLPVVVNLRIVDTNQRSMPPDLAGRAFNDGDMQSRLRSLIDALVARSRGRIRWIMIGNEIDGYFGQRSHEVAAYSQLFRAGAERFRRLQPGIQVSATFTFDGLALAGSTLKPITDQCDFLAATYYPIKPDFTTRDPGAVEGDFQRMINVAGGKRILLQEVGCPSSPINRSSEQKQAQFVTNVFDSLRGHSNAFIGANFFLMSDLPDWMVNEFAKYYSLGNVESFKAYLQTLGMFDGQGRPKRSWEVFRERTPQVNTPR
ncbi:MAG: hypothetical protein ACREAM_08465 [Blastocatellia bacterium]